MNAGLLYYLQNITTVFPFFSENNMLYLNQVIVLYSSRKVNCSENVQGVFVCDNCEVPGDAPTKRNVK